MNLSQVFLVGDSSGTVFPYPILLTQEVSRKGAFAGSKRLPQPCVTDQAYIKAELKRQRRKERNTKLESKK